MATKPYRWRTSNWYSSTTTLSHGVDPDDQSWHDTNSETGTQSATYWYRDANVMVGGTYSDSNSSRVNIVVSQSWTVDFDSRNNMMVTIDTVVNSITRLDAVGSNTDTPGRTLNFYHYSGGPLLQSITDTQVATPHTISNGFALSTYTFTIAPGQGLSRNSLFLHNEVVGGASWDDINLGIEFLNLQPADYRPGETWDGAVWESHNRNGGAAAIRSAGGLWQEMRTIAGGEDSGNPPTIRHGDSWKNMRLIGRE